MNTTTSTGPYYQSGQKPLLCSVIIFDPYAVPLVARLVVRLGRLLGRNSSHGRI
jgi:hypothetical protein